MADRLTTRKKLSPQSLTRRSLIAGAAAVAGVALTGPAGSLAATRPGRRVPFGAAVEHNAFDSDPAYAALIVENCDLIFPMNALKWDSLRYEREAFNFEPADEIVGLAGNLDRRSHGHTYVWYDALPGWLEAVSDPLEAERLLVEHIERTGRRYAGRLQSWDVVNEVIAFDPRSEGMWRSGFWHDRLGPRHVEIAFSAARRADPAALLGINDFDLEFAGERYDLRRRHVLDLIRDLQAKGIAVDYVGFQGHLYPEIPIDAAATGRFIRDLEALGVRYMITELDVIDWKLPVDPARRDLMAAAHVDNFLDATFSAAPPVSLSTWGLSDRYSWISEVMPHRQGAKNRPLPFDENLRAKPMFEVIERYLSA